jgi:hypothetical protein
MALTSELAAAEKKLAAMIDRRVADEEAQHRADAAERMMAERERAREDAESRREIQARYADAFSAFGSQAPAPVDDERPGQYRKRLFDSLQRKLPLTHDLAMIRSDELVSGPARRNFEAMLLEAAKSEGEAPSPENLPRDGSMVTRVRVDPDSGQRRTEFFGRRSFIHDLSMAPKTVVRIVDPRTQNVLFGAPFDRAPRR